MNRVTGVPMEPRGRLGDVRRGNERYVVYASCAARTVRAPRSRAFSACRESDVRVVAREVGGNYGTRNNLLSPSSRWSWAAARLGRR